VFLGRVVGQPTDEYPDADPRQWLPEDTEAALEWMDYKQSLCSGCGMSRLESFNPDGPNYEAEVLRCRACETREARGEKMREASNVDMNGMYIAVTEQ